MVRKVEVSKFANFVGTGPRANETFDPAQLRERSYTLGTSSRLNSLLNNGASFEGKAQLAPMPPPGSPGGARGRPEMDEKALRTAKLAQTLPKATGRFALARHLNDSGRPSSAAVRRRVAGNPSPRVTKKDPYELRGVGFESSATRFRRSIFPEHDMTQLQGLEWSNNTHLEPGIFEPDITHAENGPRYHMAVAAERSARSYTIMRKSNVPRLIMDVELARSTTTADVGPGKYNPKSTVPEPVKSTVSIMRSVVPRMVREYEPAGDANCTLPNYEHSWDADVWVSHAQGKQAGTVVPDASRLQDPAEVVRTRGEVAGPGERGWGVPERNIPNLNIGVNPMSDVTPDHKYDINDPFGQWTMSQELIKSPREYRWDAHSCRSLDRWLALLLLRAKVSRVVELQTWPLDKYQGLTLRTMSLCLNSASFKSKEPRFMQPIERTAAVDEREGREVSATTYGSAWYQIPHVRRDVQAPFLGPNGTGGSALMAIRHAARGVSPPATSFASFFNSRTFLQAAS